jgi:hypothetical protein
VKKVHIRNFIQARKQVNFLFPSLPHFHLNSNKDEQQQKPEKGSETCLSGGYPTCLCDEFGREHEAPPHY